MAYYLTDPYYYLPKSFPFATEYAKFPEELGSNRQTTLGRDQECLAATRRLDFESRTFHDSAKCEELLLKCRYESQRKPNAASLAAIQASRREKDQALRARGHKFPRFVSSQQLIEEYRSGSERVVPK